MATRAELQRRLSDAFSGQGWPYEAVVREGVLARVERAGAVSGDELSHCVPPDYLDRHGMTREQMARVLDQAVGGQSLIPEQTGATTIQITDNRHAVIVGDHVTVTDSTINTGNQMTTGAEASRDEILAAVGALLRAGFEDRWDDPAASDLSRVIDTRDDVTLEDVRGTAIEVARAENVEPGKVKALIGKISTGAASGLMSGGIIAALGALL
jgi:hypothetical protein